MATLTDGNGRTTRTPAWQRAAFALAAVPLLLFAISGWEHGAYVTFGIPALICTWFVLRPTRLGAAILFWPFVLGAFLYGWLLVNDVLALLQGGAASVLVDSDDTVAFVLIEVSLIAGQSCSSFFGDRRLYGELAESANRANTPARPPNPALQLTDGAFVVARLRARHVPGVPLAAERNR